MGGRIRESGMPAEEVWNSFFDVERILDAMGVDSQVMDAADFACGYGTFTIPAAQRIRGVIYAVDIDPGMLRSVEEKSLRLSLGNVRVGLRDLVLEGSGVKDESVDYVMLFNILHSEEPLLLLQDAYRILRDRGRVGILHWIHDPRTPRGPPIPMRPTIEQCLTWCLQAGFAAGSEIKTDLKPYHFGLVMRKLKRPINPKR